MPPTLTERKKKDQMAAAFFKEIKKHVPTFIPVSLAVIGEAMRRANATKMKAETECTLNGARYKINGNFTIKKII